ncbi:HEAT repeat-containing protein 1 [Athalia rosae]|uniref:HEAT repeat-containing protein 1 n=1 Tax=Athalia rosae TaxID=37344 RepID=UPI002034151B|nr:HEAT repeat-containing protein 1 [Athalia rosae]
MATSLAAQLKKLAAPQTSLLYQSKKKPSLLFDPSEAANLDKVTVFEIGQNGLDELIKLCENFNDFKKNIFAPSAVELQRSVQSAALNKRLDERIKQFLILLSPYFLLNPAHKALEWLIHRFLIHEFNKDQFLMLILPYHETKIFVRALQLVNLSDPADNWHWLKPLQKPGVTLSTTTLINRVSSDIGLLRLLCSHVCDATKIHGARASSLGTLFAFYTMALIGAIDGLKNISENQMTQILPALGRGLSSSVPDFAASSYMITAKICSKARLNKATLNFILNAMLSDPPLRHEAVLLMIHLFNSQANQLNSISVKLIVKLSKLKWFPEMLAKVKSSGANTLRFLVLLVSFCVKKIQSEKLEVTEGVNSMVKDIMSRIQFTDEEIDEILKNTLQLPVQVENIPESSKTFLVEFFRAIERQYPERFDAYLKGIVKKGDIDSEAQKVLGLLLSWHDDINSAQGAMQVLDRLHHVDHIQRIAGLNLIAQGKVQVSENYREMVNNALLARFRDDNEEVILDLLTKFSTDKLKSIFTVDVLVDELLRLVLKSNPYSPNSFGVPALRILLSLCKKNDTRVFIAVLPWLFPRNNKEINISLEVLASDYAQGNDYMKMVKKDTDENPSSPEAISSAAFHRVLDTNLLPPTSSILSTLKEQGIQGNAAHMFFSMILLGSVCRVSVGSLPHEVARDIVEIASKVIKNYPNVRLLPNCNQLNGDKIVDALELASQEILPLQVGTYVLEMVHRRLDLSVNPTLDFEEASDRSNLVLHFLQIFFQGINNLQWSSHYLWCLKIFLKRHYANAENTVCFLSQLFTKPVSAQTSLHCLQITCSLLGSEKSLLWAFQDCTFIPNLLIALESENIDCRKSAVKILEKLSHTFNFSTDGFSTLVYELAERKAEITIDPHQLSLILYSLLSPDPDVQDQIPVKQRVKLQEGLAFLMTTITKEGTPIHIVSQLLDVLCHVNGLTVLQRLAPLGIKLLNKIGKKPVAPRFAGNALKNILNRFDGSTAKSLDDSTVWKLFEMSMRDHTSRICNNGEYLPPSVLLMKQIDVTFFEEVGKLSKNHQAKILAGLIDAITECEISSVVAAGNRAVRRIKVNAQLIVDELKLMREAKMPVIDDGGSTEKRRRSRKHPEVVLNSGIVNTRAWKRGITLLEFVQRANNVENQELMVPVLFDLLRMTLQFEEQSALEYTKQLLLSSIFHLTGNSVIIPQAHLHVDAVAQCIRTSQNPQTHHHALLVLVELFKVADTKVALHNIMPIFTFMGCTVIRQDDAYSIQIISKTIETIIPVLNATEDESHACGVLRVFISSLPDIPEHRRAPLFVKLLQLLENYLHLFFLLTFESHVLTERKFASSQDTWSQQLEFALNIAHEFTPPQLLDVCIKLVRFIRSLPPTVEERIPKFKGNQIFDLEKNTDQQLRHYKYTLVRFLGALLSSSQFVNKVAELNVEETNNMTTQYYALIVDLVMFIPVVSKRADFLQGANEGKYWKVLLHHLYDILDSVNRLLPNVTFVESVTDLINHEAISVRRKALELLIARLQQKTFTVEDRQAFSTLVKPLMKIVRVKQKPKNQDSEVVEQTVLISLKLLAKILAADDPETFKPTLELTIGLIKSREGPVLASAVLCLAELCALMNPHSIQYLNKFFPAVLDLLREKCHQDNPDIVVVSVIAALQKIVESLGNFLSLYLDQLLFELARLRSRYMDTEQPKLAPIIQRLKTTMQKLSASIPLRVLLPTVTKTYKKLVSEKLYRSVDPLMNLLSDSFATAQPADLNPAIQDLADFFLKVLQFREDLKFDREDLKNEDLQQDIAIIEQSASKSLVTLILKLSEATFRPLFYRLYDWAARNPGQKLRNITFYRLSANIAESLKSLFVLFAGHFLKHAGSLLTSNNQSLIDEPQQLTLDHEVHQIELIEAILLTLYRVFMYDPRNFVDEVRFTTLAQPIIDQLENIVGGREAYEKRSKELIVPCIANFAGAIQDDSLHKQLVYQTLLKTRHVKSFVRGSALNAVVEIARKLGEDFMPLLPETIPFLAELLEDEDEDTEKLAQDAVRTLEEVLDEPLQKYF